LAFDEALGKLMWLIRSPAVTARLETDFLLPVPMGTTLHITAEITGQVNRKVIAAQLGDLIVLMDQLLFGQLRSM